MNKQDLIAAIESVDSEMVYNSYTIGVTDDPVIRRAAHTNNNEDTSDWKDWETDSEKIGREVEKYFLDKGMQGGDGGGGKAKYVYIF